MGGGGPRTGTVMQGIMTGAPRTGTVMPGGGGPRTGQPTGSPPHQEYPQDFLLHQHHPGIRLMQQTPEGNSLPEGEGSVDAALSSCVADSETLAARTAAAEVTAATEGDRRKQKWSTKRWILGSWIVLHHLFVVTVAQ